MYSLAPRQAEALRFIKSFIAEKGYGPSYREICRGLDLASSNGAHQLVHALRDRGHLKLIPAQPRSIALVEA